ncbi:MAG: hypothetical protein KDB00_20315 [Planctomycetales bacterium]|nr:hypothetical protein [Planctomycetales bacterium]
MALSTGVTILGVVIEGWLGAGASGGTIGNSGATFRGWAIEGGVAFRWWYSIGSAAASTNSIGRPTSQPPSQQVDEQPAAWQRSKPNTFSIPPATVSRVWKIGFRYSDRDVPHEPQSQSPESQQAGNASQGVPAWAGEADDTVARASDAKAMEARLIIFAVRREDRENQGRGRLFGAIGVIDLIV